MDETDYIDPTDASCVDESDSRGVSRRAMLHAGWSVPVIMAVAPSVAFAASGAVSGTTTTKGANGVAGANGSKGVNGTAGSNGAPGTNGTSGSSGVGGATAQQHEGPQPARVDRGFTG